MSNKKKPRDIEQISNDFAEDMPVSQEELVRLVKWERGNTQKAQNKVNALRNALTESLRAGFVAFSLLDLRGRLNRIAQEALDKIKE